MAIPEKIFRILLLQIRDISGKMGEVLHAKNEGKTWGITMWVKRILYVVALLVSGGLGFGAAKAQVELNDTLDVIERDYDTAFSKVDLSGIRVNSDDDIVNILLVGNDYRQETGYSAGGLTDTMMIATLDMKHKTLKLTTLMRDMLVEIPGYGNNKLNAANSFGGIELLYKTIAQNFNIQLDGYVEVSFEAFKTVVNDIGGVEIELTESEAAYLNATNYIKPAKYRTVKAGKQTLNGAQALGYCRIRKYAKGIQPVTPTGQIDDYGRTWRQRNTITSIFNKVKTLPMSEWLSIAKDVLKSDVKTDLSNKKIINYIKSVVMMGTTQIYQLQIPVSPYFTSGNVDGVGSCLTIQKEYQADAIKQFVFQYDGKEEFEYTPSSDVGSYSYDSTEEASPSPSPAY
jgi:LCP family protein required for cell wall assembly